jgi:hypothetical protein
MDYTKQIVEDMGWEKAKVYSIYEKGHENGFKDGMDKKADDFKKLLNI